MQTAARQRKGLIKGRICVVGRGRWGSSLAAALRSSGYQPCTVADRAALNRGRSTQWLQSEIFWLCVPDAQIATAAASLLKGLHASGYPLAGRTILHSSGVHDGHVLDQAAQAGASVGSIHPLMTFPSRSVVPLAGVPFAVESSPSLRARLFRLVRSIGGEPFHVSAQGKALYHAAAMLASPLLVSLATVAQSVAQQAGLTRREANLLLRPIMEATLHNFFTRGGPASFSGPFPRGDADTISLHLHALGPHPSQERVYRGLGLYALETLPALKKATLLRLLNASSDTAASNKVSRKRSMGE